MKAWPTVMGVTRGSDSTSRARAPQLDEASIGTLNSSLLSSPGGTRFLVCLLLLVLAVPAFLIVVGATSGPTDTSSGIQVGWGVVTGVAGLILLAIFALARTTVDWKGLQLRGIRSMPLDSRTIPWSSVLGFVAQPLTFGSPFCRLWVVHLEDADGPQASVAVSGFHALELERGQEIAAKLNRELGVRDTTGLAESIPPGEVYDAKAWVGIAFLHLVVLCGIGIPFYLGLRGEQTGRRRWLLLAAASADLAILTFFVFVTVHTEPLATLSGLVLILGFWIAPFLFFLALAAHHQGDERARDAAG